MENVNINNSPARFCYDPAVSDFDASFWKTQGGLSDPTVSSNILNVNAREIVSSVSFAKTFDIEFVLNIPAVPTSGDVRYWGLRYPGLGNRGAIYFDVSGTTFSVKAYAENGTTAILNETITWDSNWTAANVRYRILKTDTAIIFQINETEVASIRSGGMPDLPLAMDIKNGNSDNLGVIIIPVRNASFYS